MKVETRTFRSSDVLSYLPLNRPDVDFDVRLMRAVQVMDIPMLKDFINALVMDSLTYGKKFCPGSSIEESISSCYNHVCESRCK